MAIEVPRVPAGVRPITGDHLSQVGLGRAARGWRRAVNVAAITARRGLPYRPLPEAPPYPKLFVVGCPRSGTSWVQSILSMHPAIVTSQESHAYENVFEPVAARGATSIAGWANVVHRHDISERRQRWVGLHWWVNRARLLDFTGWALHQRRADAADVAERVIEAIFDACFVERGGDASNMLLEKTPGHLHYAARILQRFPEAKVVEVLRDGRDVCVSLQMQALTLDWPPATRRGQIELWARSVRRGLELRSDPALGGRVHLVRYETLKADPAREIRRLFGFAGLDADEGFVANVADGTDFRHHRATGDGRHTRRGEVGDWEQHFSEGDVALFRELAGDVFDAAGYRLDG